MSWCPDDGLEEGTCFTKDQISEKAVKDLGKGDYSLCSHHFSKFEGIPYMMCPRQDKCDKAIFGQQETSIPSTDGKIKTQYIAQDAFGHGQANFGTSDVCRYHYQFPNSAYWGDKMSVRSTTAQYMTIYIAYGEKF